MIHLDLFSGIGGFAYAIDQVWDDVEHIFCDTEPFAQQVLKKHWKGSYIYDDIRAITADSYVSRYIHRQSQEQPAERPHEALGQSKPGVHSSGVHLLTGGFPCQPFSAAGLRRGTSDDRYLWPEMLRVIRLAQPQWVIAENVGGLVTWNDGMVLEQVCSDLEAAGYEVQPFIIPAVAVNAPHRRDRIWFVAHSVRSDDRGTPRPDGSEAREERLQERYEMGQSGKPSEVHAPDSRRERRGTRSAEGAHGDTPVRSTPTEEDKRFERTSWERDWMEIAAEFCSVDDGLPVELDGFKLTKAQHRAKQISAYGNAIVPQVAIEILKGIKANE